MSNIPERRKEDRKEKRKKGRTAEMTEDANLIVMSTAATRSNQMDIHL